MEQSDIILDQFFWFTLGEITAEGLLSGKPVLISYKRELGRWLFPDPPPIISAFNTKEIANALIDLLHNPQKAQEIGKKGKEWFYKYHSKEVVVNKLKNVYITLAKKYEF